MSVNVRPGCKRLPPRTLSKQMNDTLPEGGFANYVGRGTLESLLLEAEDRGYALAMQDGQRAMQENARKAFPPSYSSGAGLVVRRELAASVWGHASNVVRSLTREDEKQDVGTEACCLILLLYLVLRENRIDPNQAMERTLVSLTSTDWLKPTMPGV